MPLLPPAASDFTELLKSQASVPSVNTTTGLKWSQNVTPIRSLGRLRSVVTQSKTAEKSGTQPLIYRDITPSNAVVVNSNVPPITTNLKLWVDASVQDYMTFGSNRTYGNQTYKIVTGLSNIYGANGTTVTNSNVNPPVFTYVDSAFISNAGLPLWVQPTNKPALYFRGRETFGNVSDQKYDTMEWDIGLSGKPVTLFFVAQAYGDGTIIGSRDGPFHTYSIYYAYAGILGQQGITNTAAQYRVSSSNPKPILYTFGNDLSGSDRYHYLKFNGNFIGSRASRTDLANRGLHNTNNLRIGRWDDITPETTACIVHEVLNYDAIMSSNDVIAVENYLKQKWGIS